MNKHVDIKKIEKMSKALGDPYRLKIIELVRKEHGECGWMQCCQLMEKIDLAQSTVSHHIKQLVDADLLIADKDGRNSKFQVNKDAFACYKKFLNDFED